MGNNIEKNKVNGDNNQLIGGNQNNFYLNSTEYNDYRKMSDLMKIQDSCHLIKTSHYNEAIKQLEIENAIILVGCSGIGKTSLSYSVSNYFMENKNYNFRFVSAPKGSDFHNISDIIFENCDKQEIIIIDDFLGNSKLDLSTNELTSLEDF